MELEYFVSKDSGIIVEVVKGKDAGADCCPEIMKVLKAGVTDAAVEKHVPVYTMDGDVLHVAVGEVNHPMVEEHFIEWVAIQTNQGTQRKYLHPGQEPCIDFKLCADEQVEAIYAYCNLHGLWKCAVQ